MKREGFIRDVAVEGEGLGRTLRLVMKYGSDKKPVITGLKRVSRPGLRRYVGFDEIPRVLGGMGIAILSTPAGVMTDTEARAKRVGGELLCQIW